MSKLGLVIVMLLMAGRINAQNYPAPTSDPPTYFVLIQADNGQAFYVRLDSQLYPSSPAGHLILAHLKDSAYMITVGFPGQIYPEKRFLLQGVQQDRALRLSRQDNSWGLIDDLGRTMPAVGDPAAAEMPLLAGARKDDAFSQMMAAIVRDTAVMYNTYAASSDSVPSPGSANTPPTPGSANTPPSPAAADTPAINLVARDSLVLRTAVSSSGPSSPTGVMKLSEHKSTQSLSIVYTDHPVDKHTDTIDVIIPIDTPAVAIQRNQPPDTSKWMATIAMPQVPDTIRKNVITSPVTSSVPVSRGKASRTDTPALAGAAPHKANLPFVNSDCHAFATDYDVDKLRIRMLNVNKDEDRIQLAYKVFKTKCFSTNQIAALCAVFTTDAAKFKFLEAAYPFVSDDHFPELVELLTDPVFMGKFRTLTGRH